MSLQEKEIKIKEIELELLKLKDDQEIDHTLQIQDLENTKAKIEAEAYQDISAYDRVYLARKADRPNVREYIDNLFDDFIELHGDRLYKDDGSIVGGLAMFNNIPCTVIGHLKGRTLEENLHCNFGMSSPEGYRKAMRLMKQAEKFNRPIVTFVDTPGAYPGLKAEKHGIGEAIARNLMEMSQLTVPIIVIVIGEGGSGGALALALGDEVWMMEHSIYAILSPEGFASILWKDGSRAKEAAGLMKITAQELHKLGVIEKVIPETIDGELLSKETVIAEMRSAITKKIAALAQKNIDQLLAERYQRFRKF